MLLALGVAGCGDDDDDGDSGVRVDRYAVADRRDPGAGEAGRLRRGRPARARSATAARRSPTEPLSGDYEVTFETNCGSFTVDMDEDDRRPERGVVRAARRQRLLRGHLLPPDRAGLRDPGRRPDRHRHGRPRLHDADAPPADAQYPKYTVAMAKGATEPPGTSGSQFFVMTGDSGLPPRYAIVGDGHEGHERRRPDRQARRRDRAAHAGSSSSRRRRSRPAARLAGGFRLPPASRAASGSRGSRRRSRARAGSRRTCRRRRTAARRASRGRTRWRAERSLERLRAGSRGRARGCSRRGRGRSAP